MQQKIQQGGGGERLELNRDERLRDHVTEIKVDEIRFPATTVYSRS